MKSSLGSGPRRDHLAIGELAGRFGLATHVLRHWEAIGLLAPDRTVASRRRYRSSDIYRVAAILCAKEAGFALDDIRAMLTAPGPATRTAALRRQRDDLVRRIARAQSSLDMIDRALACRHNDLATCPEFRGLLTQIAADQGRHQASELMDQRLTDQ